MKRIGLLLWVCMFCSTVLAQQFQISDYSNGVVTIEYPPSFDGAYLFFQQKSNLTDAAWETVDYSHVNLVEGENITYSPPPDGTSGGGTNAAEVPYIISTEYLEALSSGQITNEEWAASEALSTGYALGAHGF